MTDDRHYYKHKETGIVAEMLDRVAAIFGDHLERVDAPTKDSKPSRSRKKASDEPTNSDSSEGGNE